MAPGRNFPVRGFVLSWVMEENQMKDIIHFMAMTGEFILFIVVLVIVVVFIKVMVAGEPGEENPFE